jgi:hypothetical protein
VPDGASQIHRGLGARSAIPKAEVQATEFYGWRPAAAYWTLVHSAQPGGPQNTE